MNFWNSSIGRLVLGSWEATFGHRGKFILFLLMFVCAYSVDLAGPWVVGYILGSIVNNGISADGMNQVLVGVVGYTALRLIYTILHHLARYIQNTVAYHARMAVMAKMFNAFLAFPLRWHLHRHTGENLSKLHRSVGAVDQMISTYVWQLVEGLVKIIFAGITIFLLDYMVAINVLFMVMLTIGLMLFYNRRWVSFLRENNAFYDKLNRTVVDFFFNIVTVKTLRLEQSGKNYFGERQPLGLNVSQKISKFQELKWGSVSIGYSVVMGSSLWIYLSDRHSVNSAVEVASVYVLMNYLDRIFQAVNSFTGYYGAILESATAYEEGDKVLRELKDLPIENKPRQAPLDWKEFELSNLFFSYGSGNSAGIQGLSLKVKRGSKIALVGPSGGGKSTLLKIMGGMIVPEDYSLSFDAKSGYAIEDLSGISLLIPQEPEIFTETVQYNLAVGQIVDQNIVEQFVNICKVDQVISKLPGSWSNFLAEKGLNLSGGERQRIALARGLIRSKDREILLLDEPTSSVDPFTEKEIFCNLLTHFKDATVLTACHRLALVPLFDYIIYVESGVVREYGSFEDLVETNDGYFAKAWKDYQTKVARIS
jgi:ATP-binding cassette subfamily B protein